MNVLIRLAFLMRVYPDKHDEYKKRHDQIWPEMVEEIRRHGGQNYSIYLDVKTSNLFAYVEISDEKKWQRLRESPVNQKWWEYMKDIMETNPDNSPVTVNLKEIFHLD